ncbi:MAG TPA: type II secretion system protein [Candidatus Saccharimonadales bacterium]|nr:type II secretion system protein [Candidatus Saccharimonadales bacterium]
MKGHTHRAGFTIVETLLVLAISSAIFLAIIMTMSGRQGKAEFSQATKNIQADVQQTINEVASGSYPSGNNFKCTGASGKPVFSASGIDQGTNQDCVFLGKVIQFKVQGTGPEQYNIFSIAGLRACGGATTCTTLAGAKPQVINGGGFDVTETKTLSYGLSVKSATAGAVGFISELGSLDDGGNYNSGTQPVDLMPVTGTNIGMPESGTISAINNNLTTSPANPTGGFTVCFQSGNTNQTALMTIGSNGHDLAVKMEVKTC